MILVWLPIRICFWNFCNPSHKGSFSLHMSRVNHFPVSNLKYHKQFPGSDIFTLHLPFKQKNHSEKKKSSEVPHCSSCSHLLFWALPRPWIRLDAAHWDKMSSLQQQKKAMHEFWARYTEFETVTEFIGQRFYKIAQFNRGRSSFLLEFFCGEWNDVFLLIWAMNKQHKDEK